MIANTIRLLKLRRMDRKVEDMDDDLVKAIFKSKIQDMHKETVRNFWRPRHRNEKTYISQRTIELLKLLDLPEDPEDEENE